MLVGPPLESRLPSLGIQFKNVVANHLAVRSVPSDLLRHRNSCPAPFVVDDERPGAVLYKVELMAVNWLVAVKNHSVANLVTAIDDNASAFVPVRQRHHVLAFDVADPEVHHVPTIESSTTAPDKLAIAVVNVRPNPSLTRAFSMLLRMVWRKKPIPWGYQIPMVNLDIPTRSLDIRSLFSISIATCPVVARLDIRSRNGTIAHRGSTRPQDLRWRGLSRLTTETVEGNEPANKTNTCCCLVEFKRMTLKKHSMSERSPAEKGRKHQLLAANSSQCGRGE